MNCTSSKREGVRLHSTPVAEAPIALVHVRKPTHQHPNAKAFGYTLRPVAEALIASVHARKPLHHRPNATCPP